MQEWISIQNRLPDKETMVRVIRSSTHIPESIAFLNAVGEWCNASGRHDEKITYWMPIQIPQTEAKMCEVSEPIRETTKGRFAIRTESGMCEVEGDCLHQFLDGVAVHCEGKPVAVLFSSGAFVSRLGTVARKDAC